MNRNECVTNPFETAKHIKLAYSTDDDRIWFESVALSIPAPPPNEPEPASYTIFLAVSQLPSVPPSPASIPVRFPFNPRYLYLLETPTIENISEPMISLMSQQGLVYEFNFTDIIRYRQTLFISSPDSEGIFNLCLAHTTYTKPDFSGSDNSGKPFPVAVVVMPLLVKLTGAQALRFSEIEEFVHELNRQGMNIGTCYFQV